MLRINRVKVEITTENGIYGFDTPFFEGINFVSSIKNTCGKSSVLEAVYYCLGLEEIIGGQGEKVLTSVYKSQIEEETEGNQKVWNVTSSCVYLEIANGAETITLFRTAKMPGRDSHMITIYYCGMEDIGNPQIDIVDTYIHYPNSAQNSKGFHSVLEKFLHLELPLVNTTDDKQRKLYLQLIFSGMFIEQKHGWSGLFSGIPYLGIRDSKKRVIEFVLKLDTLQNEKEKERLKLEELRIAEEWETTYKEINADVTRHACTIIAYPNKPRILKDEDISRITIKKGSNTISEEIAELKEQYGALKRLKPKIIDNFDDLQKELKETDDKLAEYDEFISEYRQAIIKENQIIKTLEKNLEIIEADLTNNKDAAKLRELGSQLKCDSSNGKCPVCHHDIPDSLLPLPENTPIMSLDENIRHLEAQKKMLKFALNSHNEKKTSISLEIREIENKEFTLRRIAKSLRSDLYSVNEDFSEAIICKRLSLERQIEDLELLLESLQEKLVALKSLSDRLHNVAEGKSRLPKDKFSAQDKKKLKELNAAFVNNLKCFGYRSITNFDDISISTETYLPLYEGFDMKYDSSASDTIRLIWAFTLALLEVSVNMGGNHPTVLIFDEPAQQSTITADMEAFFARSMALSNKCQIINAVTLKDQETTEVVERLVGEGCSQIKIPNKAFEFIKKIEF